MTIALVERKLGAVRIMLIFMNLKNQCTEHAAELSGAQAAHSLRPPRRFRLPGLKATPLQVLAGLQELQSSAVLQCYELYSCAAPAIFLSSPRLLITEEKLF